MAKKEIYICDNCQREFKDDDHLSFNFNGNNNGLVRKQVIKDNSTGNDYESWRYVVAIPRGGVYQFCDFKCMEKYFNKIKEQCQLKKLKE